MGKVKSVVTDKKDFEHRDESISKVLSETLNYHDSDILKKRPFSNWSFCLKSIATEDLIEEVNPVVIENGDFEDRKENVGAFIGKYRTTGFSMHGIQLNSFQLYNLPQVWRFRLIPWSRKSKLQLFRKKSLYRMDSLWKSVFWFFQITRILLGGTKSLIFQLRNSLQVSDLWLWLRYEKSRLQFLRHERLNIEICP